MASAAKYTRLVLFGKNFLWLLTAGIIILIIWIASSNNSDNGGRIVFTSTPKKADLENIMHKPRYQGVDVNNRPYTINADTGVQKDKDTVLLKNITADMTSDNDAWIALKAGSGILHNTSKKTELLEGVEIFYEGGYQFRTDRANINNAEGTVYGDSPVEGVGPTGTITANSFTILGRGNIIKFNGSVTMLLYE